MKSEETKSKRLKATFNCCDDKGKESMIWVPITWAGTPLPHEMMLTQTPMPSHLFPPDSDPTWIFKVFFLVLLLLVKLLWSQLGSAISSFILCGKQVMEGLQLLATA